MLSSPSRLISSRLIAAVVLSLAFGPLTGPAAAGEPPFGLAERTPWTNSRLVGSPEPPLPYAVEKTFAGHTFKAPIYIADEPASDRLLVVLRGGDAETPSRIVRIADDPAGSESQVVFELPKRLIYAVCFDPRYATNHHVYIFSNGPTPETERTNRVSRFTVQTQPDWRIEPQSELVLLEWRSAGHDGGDLAFGNDGMFYVVTGDGTADSDGWNSGQTLDDLLGAVLRVDVRKTDGQRNYVVPPDNPFVNTPGARGEIWAYGLRNPWRMCLDAKTGHIWVGNNGQDLWETAHLVRRGENYGWSVYEGSHPFYLDRQRGPTPIVPPTIEHSHAEFRSLTGGVVYYGSKLPELEGAYVYGDYSSGRIWGMKHDGSRVQWHRELADTSLAIAGFRVDQRGELLIADHVGGIYRLVPAPKSQPPAAFPERLSETGLFASTSEHRVDPALVPYSINAHGWADGAHAERFIALPGETQIEYDTARSWNFPDGTALVQTLSLDGVAGGQTARRRIETRVLLRQQGEWAGYSYRWNAEGSDALLVPKEGADAQFEVSDDGQSSMRAKTWRFPSRAECMACHSRAANFVLGLTEAQLNRQHDYPAARDQQLRAFNHINLFKTPLTRDAGQWATIANPHDESQPLEARVRAYLHVNCSICHVAAGGGNSKMELALSTSSDKMNLVGARPQHDTFGIVNAMLVAPGDPDRSVLVHRLSRRGRGQMPPLASHQVDERAVALVRQWIAQLVPERKIVRQWQMDDLLPAIDEVKRSRSLTGGQKNFRDTGCIQCHRFAGEGGTVGPDLTAVGKRASPRELLESILQPSKVVADEYALYAIETTEGEVISGRIEREDSDMLLLRPASAVDAPARISKKDIIERKRLPTSNMPSGTVDVLEKEQVLDLLAFLLSGANPAATTGAP